MNHHLIKLNRLFAWLLLILMLVYFFTGFDMLKNLWQPDFSRFLHNQLLPLPTIILLIFHSAVGVKLFLIRHNLNDKTLNLLLISAGLVIALFFIYLFYR